MSPRFIGVFFVASLLGACAVSRPSPSLDIAATNVAPAWLAPTLPHDGNTVSLLIWWERFNDTVLNDWIARTQVRSPSIAAARSQVFAARAARIGKDNADGLQAGAIATATRGITDPRLPLGTNVTMGVQASWALDVWGGNRAGVARAQAEEDGAQANWHAARVLVASELAQLYFSQRLCRVQLGVTERDSRSRAITAKAAGHTERAGLTAPAVAALARASAAESTGRMRQQADQCERQIKSLVALTGLAEPELRAQLAQAPPLLAGEQVQSLLSVQAVPMAVLRQRPDVYQAQRGLVAASEGVGVAKAALLPSLSLAGSLLHNRFTTGGQRNSFNTWSVGPLTLSLPLLGRDGLQAGVDSAQARYEAAALAYASTLRGAVAEVEQALVGLDGQRQRELSNAEAVAGYAQSFQATEARYQVGFANLNELEDARRLLLNVQSNAVALEQERISTWISLYVALGGGFDPENPPNALKNPS